jgi:2'-5' RNA ligase
MAMIRTFIAVDIPQDIKMDLDRLISGFRHEGKGIRWVRAQNLHLTLRFLGDVDENSIPGLAESIKTNLNNTKPFDLALKGLGGFPNLKKPRVIWIGSNDPENRLYDLAFNVENACREAGFGKSDKKFSAHLTIGRIKFPKGLEGILKVIENSDFASELFSVGEVVIYKSVLSAAGPTYTKLETITL